MAFTKSVALEAAEDNEVLDATLWDPTTWEPPLAAARAVDPLDAVRADVVHGVVWFTVGLVVTVATFVAVSGDAEGRFAVFWGPVAWGLYLLGRAVYAEGRAGRSASTGRAGRSASTA